MNAPFRIVHFIPRAMDAGRIPIGAVVNVGGRIEVARASLVPGEACLGVPGAEATVRLILDCLDEALTIDHLPPSVGPHAMLDTRREVPPGVAHPRAWIEQHVLPRSIETRERTSSGPRRELEGFRLLESLRVDQYVEKRFKPGRLWRDESRPTARALQPVSQFVDGGTDLLLMEPIAASRPSYNEDLQHVSGNFMKYRFEIEHRTPGIDVKLLAYLLPGGGDDRRRAAARELGQLADEVIDTSVAAGRTHLAQIIQKTAQQRPLPLT